MKFNEETLEHAVTLPNTKIKLLQKLLTQAIEEFKKVNRIKGVDFTRNMKSQHTADTTMTRQLNNDNFVLLNRLLRQPPNRLKKKQ